MDVRCSLPIVWSPRPMAPARGVSNHFAPSPSLAPPTSVSFAYSMPDRILRDSSSDIRSNA